ncbi:MAG TPA: hypothetical protein VIA98_05725 [Allosphingosinicella sp.]|jgi:uncharacterized membrane protein YeaQ/YmgE (transglycosylase-associated protein family)
MGRTILGVVAGIIAAFATIWAIEMVHHLLYPVPDGVRLTNKPALAGYLSGMSLPQLLFIACGWLVGAFVGGVVAAKIAGRSKAVWIVAGLVALAGIGNIFYVSHPLFLQISAIVAPLIGGWLATRAVSGRAAPAFAAEGR